MRNRGGLTFVMTIALGTGLMARSPRRPGQNGGEVAPVRVPGGDTVAGADGF